ncbi:competence protein ComK [Bacillus sp. FJAT-42315]|uniref:competence protein ComK n=1 Tax=Bacillus sp. FJAT-42315 TaxID=2014077 RepID=UPI001E38E89A|nr:competence protein ComK [Bacillus sp. FJAT-42315]
MVFVESYLPSTSTMGLVEHRQKGFHTIIYDEKGTYYTHETAKQLLNKACLHRLFTYEGRLQATRKQLNYYKKTPLLICHEELIYTFPTISPEEPGCCWIFPRHVQSHSSIKGKMVVCFKNGVKLPLNCSPHVYYKQLDRATNCITYMLKNKESSKIDS